MQYGRGKGGALVRNPGRRPCYCAGRSTVMLMTGTTARLPLTSTLSGRAAGSLSCADVDGLVVRLEKEIDELQDRLDQFNHDRKIEVDGRTLELAS